MTAVDRSHGHSAFCRAKEGTQQEKLLGLSKGNLSGSTQAVSMLCPCSGLWGQFCRSSSGFGSSPLCFKELLAFSMQ